MLNIAVSNYILNLIYFLVFIIILWIIRNFSLQYLKKRITDKKQFRLYKLYLNYIYFFIILFFIIPIFLPSLKELVTVLSIFGAGILIVFKEILLNFFGFFYLIIRRPFKVGDRIKINDSYGDVLDIRLLDFTILQLYPMNMGGQNSGRVLNIPNSYVFLNPVINFSKEFAFNWVEIKIPLCLNSDWQKAEKISLDIIEKILSLTEENGQKITSSLQNSIIQYSKISPKTFIDFNKGTIIISLRFLCEPKEQRIVRDLFWREFLKKIRKEKSIKLKEDIEVDYDF